MREGAQCLTELSVTMTTSIQSANSCRYDQICAEAVQVLDPLKADARLAALPLMNQDGDVSRLVEELKAICPSLEQVESFRPVECLAVMRDLGMFLGSIKRHGVEPLGEFPEIESILERLGRRTDMIPRDTVQHYISWNPTGTRERNYTLNPMESKLMGAVRISMPALGRAIEGLHVIRKLDLLDPELVFQVWGLADQLKVLEEAMHIVLREVSPRFFAQDMRHYFVDIEVGGGSYLGPAAAHAPVALVDLGLWVFD